jgi:hypothetical protein
MRRSQRPPATVQPGTFILSHRRVSPPSYRLLSSFATSPS